MKNNYPEERLPRGTITPKKGEAAMADSWTQKFNRDYAPVTKRLDKNFSGIKAGEMMLISTPRDIVSYVRAIPEGEARSIPQMRDDLADAAGADKTCPLTASIYLRFAIEAELEGLDGAEDSPHMLPFWRVLDAQSPLAKKLSCGTSFITRKRQAEGLE
ncbi:MAG: hypothetical protein J4F41_06615 [Alphaproteobacteria bacterium]|nr:hypothetical protein [Alphaproteobacteria bacterium]